MIANLPMYDRPELTDAHNEFWNLIKDNLIDAGLKPPAKLAQNAGEFKCWTDTSFYFSQTCGKPYSNILHENVTLTGTPDYDLEDCPPGYYRSAYIINKFDDRENLSDHKNSLFAYNDKNSQSGYHVTKNYFTNEIESGSHINSVKMVAGKTAEIAAIDANSLKLMTEYDDFVKDIKIIEWSDPTPTLPFIAFKGANQELFFNAIKNAIASLSQKSRRKLHLKDIVFIPKETYLENYG